MAPKLTPSTKKKRKLERMRRYHSQNVNIGDVVQQWNDIKRELKIVSDRTFADFLIQAYKRTIPPTTSGEVVFASPTHTGPSTSTPIRLTSKGRSALNISLSTVTTSTATEESTETATEGEREELMGVSVLRGGTSHVSSSEVDRESPSPKKRKLLNEGLSEKHERPRRSLPFIQIAYDLSELGVRDDDDPTFEPSQLEFSFVDDEGTIAAEEEIIDLAEEVHDLEDSGNDFEECLPSDSKGGRAIPQKEEVTLEDVNEIKYLIFQSCLALLLQKLHFKCHVKSCKEDVTYSMTENGSAVAVTWRCAAGHNVYYWTSQPQLPNGIFLGNFQALSAVTVSGNNFTKIALFAKFLSLGFPTTRTHSRIQTKYVAPVVEKYWDNLKSSVVEEHRSAKVVVSGDGRMDSPGHSAKYCTYTVMNQADKKILAMEIIDKRECQLKSGIMEAEGFKRSIASLQAHGVDVQEIVTDAHPQISSIMKKNFPNIRHSYDMWHGAKNLGKKLAAVACSKGNEILKPWLSDITNHFFYCADTCDGNVEIMQAKWVSVLNHIVNKHSWALGQCDHDPIQEEERDKDWLSPKSRTYDDLQRSVLEPRLLKSFHYYTTCQTTSELASFNNHILMYAPKRSAFSYESYKCRCYLAAIDYTMHLERDPVRDKNGNKVHKRKFSKGSNNWTSAEVKVPKTYSYIPKLMMAIVNEYCGGYQLNPLRAPTVLSEKDPRNIASTIAPKEPPPTSVLVQSLKHRIKKKDTN